MTQDLSQLAEKILTTSVVDESLLTDLAAQLHNAGLLFQAEAVYKKLFYHDPLNDHSLAKYLSFLTGTQQIRKAVDFLLHCIVDIHATTDRHTWLIQILNSLPNNEDWQRRVKRFSDINQVTFKKLTNLELFCAATNTPITQVYPEQYLSLPRPKANRAIYQNNAHGAYLQPSVNVAIVERLMTSSNTFTLQTKDHAIRAEFAAANRDDYILNSEHEQAVLYVPESRSFCDSGIIKKSLPTHKTQGLCLSLLAANDNNYYHFLYEQFPKVLLLAQLNLAEPVTVLLRADCPESFKQLFDYYDLDVNIEYIENNKVVEMERGIVISGLGNTVCDLNPHQAPTKQDNCFSTHALTLLSQGAKPEIQSDAPKKIFLARVKGSGGRTALNDDDVARFAEANGFTSVYPETLSLKQQINLFYNADSILGISGAAFSNMIFCRPNTKVLIITLTEANLPDYPVWSKPAHFGSLDLHFFCTNHIGSKHIYRTFCDKQVDLDELQPYFHRLFDAN